MFGIHLILKHLKIIIIIILKRCIIISWCIWKVFVSTFLKCYELDPCHYFSAPGLSWDAKICNPDMHIFTERCMRGGISYASKRYSKANNEFCPDYDKNKPKVYTKYLDMNNSYGDAMSEYLPLEVLNGLKSITKQ